MSTIPPPPEGQNPRDTELLEQLASARARARKDGETQRIATGELIAGWQPRVELLAHFKGLGDVPRDVPNGVDHLR